MMAWTWVPLTVSIGNTKSDALQFVGSNTISSLDPCPARNCHYSAISGQRGIMAYSGMAVAPGLGSSGSLLITGGGDADYWGDEVYAFDLATNVWRRLNNPSTAMTGAGYPTDTTFDAVHGEYADGAPGAGHTYDLMRVVPGGTQGKGILVVMTGAAVYGRAVGTTNGWTHACDLGTGIWSRYSSNPVSFGFGNVACYDASRNRVWVLPPGGFHSNLAYLDLASRTHYNATLGNSLSGYNPVACQFPVNGLLLFQTWLGSYGSPVAFALCAVDLSKTASGVINLNLAGDVPPKAMMPSHGFDWDTDANVGYVFPSNCSNDPGDLSHVYKVTPPQSDYLGGTWTLTKIALPQALPANDSDGIYSRWRYVKSIRKFAYVATTVSKVALWTPGG